MAGVVAHDEDDVARPLLRYLRTSSGEVDAGDGVRRHGPGGGLRPVAAVGQARDRIVKASRLVLGKRHRRQDVGGDSARPHPPVVPEPVDVQMVLGCERVYLEVNGLAAIHADVGRESLDCQVPGTADVPLTRGSGDCDSSCGCNKNQHDAEWAEALYFHLFLSSW